MSEHENKLKFDPFAQDPFAKSTPNVQHFPAKTNTYPIETNQNIGSTEVAETVPSNEITEPIQNASHIDLGDIGTIGEPVGETPFDMPNEQDVTIQNQSEGNTGEYEPNPIDHDKVSIEEVATEEEAMKLGYVENQEDLNQAQLEITQDIAATNEKIGANVGERIPPMRIKEIKCGVTVIANIGNYENIRTHLEATAEIESESDLMDAMTVLNRQLKELSRKEYLEIKLRTVESKKRLGDRLNPL